MLVLCYEESLLYNVHGSQNQKKKKIKKVKKQLQLFQTGSARDQREA